MKLYDMIIIGGGPAGYTTALYAVRAGLKTLVLEKLSAGGQMALTHIIDNYPGFPDGVDGFELGQRMQQQAERFGAETELAEVTALELEGAVKVIHSDAGTFHAKTVIIATGADPRPLGIAGEQALTGRGIHYCAACDGMFYRGKTVIVVGGGNSAVADALTLSRVARKVIIVHRRDQLRASKVYHAALEAAENVEFCWNAQVAQVLWAEKVTGAVVRDVHTGAERVIPCDGVFVSIGRAPVTAFLGGQVALDEGGYILAGESTETSLPGVFAVGDVRTKAVRQVVTAVADGAAAVHGAEGYLALG